MLYWLAEMLQENGYQQFRLFEYLTFRAALAIIMSLVISMLLGGRIIRYLQQLQIGETVRDLGLVGQKEKQGTPTMGGIIIIMAIIIPCLLFADLTNVYILLMLVTTTWMGIIGFIDDYIKVFKKDKEGLSGKFKVLGQIGLGVIVACTMLWSQDVVVRMNKKIAIEEYKFGAEDFVNEILVEKDGKGPVEFVDVKTTLTNVPFFKGKEPAYSGLLFFLGANAKGLVWLIYIPFIIFIITAVSNGANLTDGIDGLATGTSAIMAGTLALLAYVSGNSNLASYLTILYLPGTGELVVFAACFLGACIGFLWYNSYPAQVFMGDTGSLTIGAIIAVLAIAIRKEWLIPILCGIFLVENLSVVLQVSYFKYTRKKYGEGRRIFLMSPLHHHYQKKGMHESKIVTRFWIVGILLAVVTILTLKLR
ncbi:MAG: phospho-N-acetylmuramoyl-pentapeptide-transferase [Gammaproteobacteria bacterium]|jgi:phospho-N-acetylmuramoyl-pentapeptide-transferase